MNYPRFFKNVKPYDDLLPILDPMFNPPRPVHRDRHHPKDFSVGARKKLIDKIEKNTVKELSAGSTDVVKSIPDPVPDTGLKSSRLSRPTGSTMFILPPVSEALAAAQSSVSQTTATTTSSILSTSASMTTAHTVSPTPSSTNKASSHDSAAANAAQQGSHHPSLALIVMFAVGAAFVLLGIMIMFKVRNRPRKRTHLIPSNPIPQEYYTSDKFSSDDSPLFGGKDRFSATTGGHTSGLWPWTQYQSGIPKGFATAPSAGISTSGATKYTPSNQEKDQYPLATLTVPGTKSTNTPQPVQSAANRATSRLSAASMSVYPTSPREDIGLALDGLYASEIAPIIARSKSLPKKRHSIMTMESNNRETRYSQGLAYNGTVIASPTLPPTAQSLPKIAIVPASTSGGRARVKSSYYAPGTYPRVSNTEADSTSRLDKSYHFDSSQDNLHYMSKSGPRRDRDTQALTSALGLSPVPPSPQPTLYPDDSLSMVGGYQPVTKRSSAKLQHRVPVPRHRLDTPPVDTSATLGSLMLVDFGSGLTTLKSFKEGISEEVEASQTSNSHSKRGDDKPPRVPSPPPLPSLAQMGLQHANPEAYASYRSPTYSIYGLYESDRKSKTTSFGY